MKDSELEAYRQLISAVRRLLNHQEKLGIKNLPMEFSGVSSDMLYDSNIGEQAFIVFVDALIQDVKNEKEKKILDRFEMIERVLTKVYEWNRKLANGKDLSK